MDQGQGSGVPPDQLDLMDGNEIKLDNLRTRINYEFTNRGLDKKTFAGRVLAWIPVQLENYLQSTQKNEQCGFAHFQMYDWLKLDEADRARVLRGGNAENGHFEMFVYGSKAKMKRKHRNLPTLDQNTKPEDLALLLDYELQTNTWTRSQFAVRVGIGCGADVADIINNIPPVKQGSEDFYRRIYDFLKKNQQEKKRIMEGVKVRKPHVRRPRKPAEPEQPKPEDLRGYHLEYVAKPDSISIRDDLEFKRNMQIIADASMALLNEEIALRGYNLNSGNLMTSTRNLLIFLHHSISACEKPRERLINLAFLNGSHVDHDKVAECIRHVLDVHSKDYKEFAEIVLKCPVETFQSYLDTPSETLQNLKGRPLFQKICKYLTKSHMDRKAAWTREYRTTHMEFLADPFSYDINNPHFKHCMRILAQRELDKLKGGEVQTDHQNYTDRKSINDATEAVLKHLAGVDQGEEMLVRERLVSMTFTNSCYVDYGKLAECLRRHVKPKDRKKFAKNVLGIRAEELEPFLNSLADYIRTPKSEQRCLKIFKWFMCGSEERKRALNGV